MYKVAHSEDVGKAIPAGVENVQKRKQQLTITNVLPLAHESSRGKLIIIILD